MPGLYSVPTSSKWRDSDIVYLLVCCIPLTLLLLCSYSDNALARFVIESYLLQSRKFFSLFLKQKSIDTQLYIFKKSLSKNFITIEQFCEFVYQIGEVVANFWIAKTRIKENLEQVAQQVTK